MADGKKQDNAGGSVFRAPAPRPKSVAPAPPSAVRGRPLQPQQPTAGILASSIRGTSMTRASEIGSVSSVDASRRSSLHGLLPHERDRNKLVLAPRQGQSFKLPHESLKGPGPWIKLEGTRTAKSTPGVHHQEGANRSTTTSTRKGNDENAVPGTVTPPSKARPKVLKRHSDVALLQQPPRSQSSAKDAREFRKHVFYLHPASVNDQDKAEFTQQIERLGAVGPASQLQCMVFDQTWFTSRCQRVDVFLSKSTTHLIRSHVRADNIDAKALRLNPNVHIWGPNGGPPNSTCSMHVADPVLPCVVAELKERLSRYLKPENAAVPVRKSLTQRFLEEKLHGPSTSRGAVDEKKYHYFKGRYLLCEEKSGAFKPILVKEYGKGQEDTDDPQKPYPTLYCDKVVLNRCPFNYHDYQEEDIKASIARDHERYRQAKLEDQTRLARKQGKRRKRMARAFREFGSLSMVYFANETEMQESEDALRRAIAKKTEQSVDVVNRLADQAMEAEADENGKPRHSNSNHRPSHSMASGQSKVTLVASIGGASVEASGFGKSQSTMSRILQGAEMPAYKHNGLVVDLSRPGSKNKKRKSAASEAPADPSERIMPAFMTKAGYCEHCCVKYDQFHEVRLTLSVVVAHYSQLNFHYSMSNRISI